jgi:hypothetical protein
MQCSVTPVSGQVYSVFAVDLARDLWQHQVRTSATGPWLKVLQPQSDEPLEISMSNVVITGIVGVGQFGVPGSDAELALATAGFDALLATIPNLTYDRVLAMVDDREGPDGASGPRTLRCSIEMFLYNGDECPLPAVLNALAIAIEIALEGDPDISTIGPQYFTIFSSGSYFGLWARDASGGFLYPVTATDLVNVPGMLLDQQATVPGGAPGAGHGTLWARNTSPTKPCFTDSGGSDHQIEYTFPSGRSLYVSVYGSASGNGTPGMPFNTIQGALTAAASLVPTPSGLNPVEIFIGPGLYNENVVVQLDGIFLNGAVRDAVSISVTAGSALTVTNATTVSLAAYNASGNYAHLVNIGSAGPRTFGAENLLLRTTDALGCAVRLLGVAGDAGAGITDFLDANYATTNNGFGFINCYLQQNFVGAATCFYARNVNYIGMDTSFWMGAWHLVNVSNPVFSSCFCGPGDITYVAGDPQGEPSWGMIGAYFFNHQMHGADFAIHGSMLVAVGACNIDDVVIDGTAIFGMKTGTIDSIDANGAPNITLYNVLIETTIDAEANVVLDLKDVTVAGATTITAGGAGTVLVRDVAFEGGLTDAGGKVDRTFTRRRVKTGTATGGGAGDVAVAFTVAFPDANYKIALGNIDASAAVIKGGTKAAGGFTLTFGAAGDCDWTATHD